MTGVTVEAPAGLKAAQGFVGMLATLAGGWWLGEWAGLLLAAGLTLQVESVRWRQPVRHVVRPDRKS